MCISQPSQQLFNFIKVYILYRNEFIIHLCPKKLHFYRKTNSLDIALNYRSKGDTISGRQFCPKIMFLSSPPNTAFINEWTSFEFMKLLDVANDCKNFAITICFQLFDWRGPRQKHKLVFIVFNMMSRKSAFVKYINKYMNTHKMCTRTNIKRKRVLIYKTIMCSSFLTLRSLWINNTTLT